MGCYQICAILCGERPPDESSLAISPIVPAVVGVVRDTGEILTFRSARGYAVYYSWFPAAVCTCGLRDYGCRILRLWWRWLLLDPVSETLHATLPFCSILATSVFSRYKNNFDNRPRCKRDDVSIDLSNWEFFTVWFLITFACL